MIPAATIVPRLRSLIDRAASCGRQLVDETIRLQLSLRQQLSRRQTLKQLRIGRPVILFVATEAGVPSFFSAHTTIARTLVDAGYLTLNLSCDGLLPICSVKFAHSVGPTAPHDRRNSACEQCRKTCAAVGSSYRLADVSIETVLTAELRRTVQSILDEHAAEPWLAIYDGIEFGKACLGETYRAQRKSSFADFGTQDHAVMRALLETSLSIYVAVEELARRQRLARIVYYGDYAFHLPLLIFARRHSIPVSSLGHGYVGDIDHRLLSVRDGFAYQQSLALLDRWPSYRDRPLDPAHVEQIFGGTLTRLRGHGGISTYSPNWSCRPGDLRLDLGLDPAKRTIVAYPSSADEIVCVRSFMSMLGMELDDLQGPFADHTDWITQLVAWAGTQPDVQLVVRAHPRMAKNVRYKSEASDAVVLRRRLEHVPPNVIVKWPEDPISSYNLAEIADVAVTAWSSMSLELACFGVPVVTAFPRIGLTPGGSFAGTADTITAYFGAIEAAMCRDTTLDSIRDAFRWTNLVHLSHLIDVSDLVPTRVMDEILDYKKPGLADHIVRVVGAGEDIVNLNMAAQPPTHARAIAEQAALVRCIEAFVGYFATGHRIDAEAGLVILSEGGEPLYRTPGGRACRLCLRVSRRGMVDVVGGPAGNHRYSAVVHRLGLLLAQLANKSPGDVQHGALS